MLSFPPKAPPARVRQVAELLRVCYAAILQREPEPGVVESYSRHLARNRVGMAEILANYLGSAEMRDGGLQRLLARYAPDHPLIFDRAQEGEVAFLLKAMVNDAAAHRVVVDVGARGRDRSNSYDFLRTFGWRGLLIEANPGLIASIRAEFAGLDFELINCAVADYDGEATFYLGVNDDVSSLHEHAARGWGDTKGEVRVPVRRLPGLLAERAVPHDFDLLSLDIEGSDIAALDDLVSTSPYRPRRVIMEVCGSNRVQRLEDLPLNADVVGAYDFTGAVGANIVMTRKTPAAA